MVPHAEHFIFFRPPPASGASTISVAQIIVLHPGYVHLTGNIHTAFGSQKDARLANLVPS